MGNRPGNKLKISSLKSSIHAGFIGKFDPLRGPYVYCSIFCSSLVWGYAGVTAICHQALVSCELSLTSIGRLVVLGPVCGQSV